MPLHVKGQVTVRISHEIENWIVLFKNLKILSFKKRLPDSKVGFGAQDQDGGDRSSEDQEEFTEPLQMIPVTQKA